MHTSFLKDHLLAAITATMFALALGVISAMLGALAGPALQLLLLEDNSKSLSFAALFGDVIGPLLESWYPDAELSRSFLFQYLPMMLIVIAGSRALLSISQWFIWERVAERVSLKLRQKIFDQFLRQNPSSSSKNDELVVASMANDVKMIREYIVKFFGGLPREGLQAICYLVMLAVLAPKLLAIFLFVVAPVVLLVNRLGKKIRRRSEQALQNFSELSEWLQRRLLGIETIKHLRTEELEIENMKKINRSMFEKFFRAARVKARTSPVIESVAIVAMAGVLYYSLGLVRGDELSGAVLLSFLSTLGLFSQSAGKLGKYFNANREGTAAVERYIELERSLETAGQEKVGIRSQFGERTGVELKGVRLSYDQTHSVLNNVDIELEGGRVYCICGPTGSGKTTLLRHLLGLLPADGGSTKFFTRSKSNPVGYLPQASILVPASLAENIAYPELNIEADRLAAAIRDASLAEVVGSLAEREATQIGWDGQTKLSGGQIQRIGIARLLYHQPEIVFMDEATSALDPPTEKLIYQSIRRLADKGSLVVLIAHRMAALDITDKIILLNGGEVRAFGPTKEVVGSKEFSDYVNLKRS